MFVLLKNKKAKKGLALRLTVVKGVKMYFVRSLIIIDRYSQFIHLFLKNYKIINIFITIDNIQKKLHYKVLYAYATLANTQKIQFIPCRTVFVLYIPIYKLLTIYFKTYCT